MESRLCGDCETLYSEYLSAHAFRSNWSRLTSNATRKDANRAHVQAELFITASLTLQLPLFLYGICCGPAFYQGSISVNYIDRTRIKIIIPMSNNDELTRVSWRILQRFKANFVLIKT